MDRLRNIQIYIDKYINRGKDREKEGLRHRLNLYRERRKIIYLFYRENLSEYKANIGKKQR